MDIAVRPATDSDTDACACICYEGLRVVNERHDFPPIFPSVEAARQRVGGFIQHPSVFGLVAEGDHRVVGFCFLSERDPMRAIAPIVTDPAIQGRGVGRRLMEAALERARGTRGVRLLQDTFNVKSLSLYAALGFDALEFLVVLSGVPRNAAPPGWEIRNLSASDIAGCECLHASVHGYTRTNELRDALETGAPIVALRDGRVRAYMVAPTNWLANHGVAATEEDMQALLLGASQLVRGSISLLMPVRRADLFRWCLTEGYRAIRPMTLMTVGEYREPQGSSCTETDRPSLDASVMRVRPLPRHCDLPHQKDPADLASVNSAARTPATPPKTSAAFPAANDSATATVPAYRLTICVPMTARERQGRGRLTA